MTTRTGDAVSRRPRPQSLAFALIRWAVAAFGLQVLALLRPGVLAVLLACSSAADRGAEERMALLLAAEAVEVDAPYQEREVMVERLARVPLTDPELVALRATCVKGWQSLIAGERGHGEAAAALASAAEASEAGNFSAESRREIEAILVRASENIAEAKGQIHQCLERLSALEVKRTGSS